MWETLALRCESRQKCGYASFVWQLLVNNPKLSVKPDIDPLLSANRQSRYSIACDLHFQHAGQLTALLRRWNERLLELFAPFRG